MTNDEFNALSDDGMERHLIRGVLLEKPATFRNYLHSKTAASLAQLLKEWALHHPNPGGQVLSGDVGFDLGRNPDTSVGIDVAYVSAETAALQTNNAAIVVGVPVLAVEILSPKDTIEEINRKIDVYIACGVKQVWIVDPHFRTVRVHRPGHKPKFYADDDDLMAEPDLPEFSVPVARFFD